jgi:hypothetical protein
LIDPQIDPVHFVNDEVGRTVVNVHQVVRDLTGNIIADQVTTLPDKSGSFSGDA